MRVLRPITAAGRTLAAAALVAVVALAAAPARAGDPPAAGAGIEPSSPEGGVAIVTVDTMPSGEIDDAFARSFARRLDLALATRPRFVVIELDTLGGELHATRDIVARIEACPVETVALVRGRAISAGSFIALSTGSIFMLPDASMGDCEVVFDLLFEGLKTAPEKIITVMRSDFEALAQKHGYPLELAKAMVDKAHENVFKVLSSDHGGPQKTEYLSQTTLDLYYRDPEKAIADNSVVVPSGQLLTMHAPAAAEYGFATIVQSEADLLSRLSVKAGGRALAAVRFEPEPWEAWSGLLTKKWLQALLFFVGLLGIAIEATHVGMIAPGAIGLFSLAAACAGGFLAGRTTQVDMALVAFGLLLLGIEMFVIPGFGVVGFGGIACIFVGGFLSLQSFGLPTDALESELFRTNLERFGGGLVGTMIVFGVFLRFLPQSPLLRRVVLSSTQRPEDGYTIASASSVALVGRRGFAASTLRPSGKVTVGDETVDAESDGPMIEKGAPIEVIGTSENHVVVRAVTVAGGGARA